jgi:hypothetical protein
VEKKHITILIIILGVLTSGFVGFLLHFWYHQTHTGSFSGMVIDAVTGEPIEGAVVTYDWYYSGFFEEPWSTSYETVTDKEGKYFIPNQRVKRNTILLGTLQQESVLIYKNNYAGYKLWRGYKKPPMGRSFGYPRKDQPYCKKNNLIKLYPWKEGESHEEHVDWIGCSDNRTLLWKELEEEKKLVREEQLAKWKNK